MNNERDNTGLAKGTDFGVSIPVKTNLFNVTSWA
jgi:hypothetical protein